MSTPLLGEAGHAVFFDDPKAGEKFYGIYGATKGRSNGSGPQLAGRDRTHRPSRFHRGTCADATAVRARFHPGEDRDALTSTADEAARILALL